MSAYRRVVRWLDRLYLAGGVLAALFLIAILCLIVVQMVARWSGWAGLKGAPDYAGYCMAAASFLAFAHALNNGAHIRVSILLNALGPAQAPGKARYVLELWCIAFGAVATSYLAFYAIRATLWSHKFHDISQGQDATPIWIPQLGMCIGAALLALCFWDNLLRLLVLRRHAIEGDTDTTFVSQADPESNAS